VPNVVGQKLARAKAKIRSRHCAVGKITRTHAPRSKRGRVLAQRPKGGANRPRGTKIALKVGA
jgi:beta-lactam-binding protein with PASTA domain